jgi:hypothetical protein
VIARVLAVALFALAWFHASPRSAHHESATPVISAGHAEAAPTSIDLAPILLASAPSLPAIFFTTLVNDSPPARCGSTFVLADRPLLL